MILEHLDLQSPSSQQIFTVLVRKMIHRINDGAAALCKKRAQPKFEKEHGGIDKILIYYNNILQNFSVSLMTNLYPGANYARRSKVLDILTFLGQSIGFNAVKNNLDLTKLVTEASANTLVSCLHDSYEDNKEKALQLLQSLPPSILHHDDPEHLQRRFQNVISLMTSSKPPDTLTGSYMTRLLRSAPALHWVLADSLSILHAKAFHPDFLLVVYLRNLLSRQIQVSKNDLLEAAGSGPMYGTLFVLRNILKEVFKSLQTDGEFSDNWVQLVADIIQLCYQVWRTVSSVVVSDSPEGHLPNDKARIQRLGKQGLSSSKSGSDIKLDPREITCGLSKHVMVCDVFPDEIALEIVDELVDSVLGVNTMKSEVDQLVERVAEVQLEKADDDEMEDLSEKEVVKAKEVSSQMVLLCAWRSVKEVSLLLSDLCGTFCENGRSIISVKQIQAVSQNMS